jgi:diaminohydroxyphosphoribosylaminopyrimidine deaminase / 5-amino-6-(5-phosphoribosylamino)uracil reductase
MKERSFVMPQDSEQRLWTPSDRQYMQLALQMAAAVEGSTSPNPMVGAVIVKDGRIVGMGAHLKVGEPHAEVHALSMAADKARNATLYVTLEPCSHYGRTPPCAEQVIEAGISRCVIAALDPNPLVAGRGLQKLKEAGLSVEHGLFAPEAEKLNETFNHFMNSGSPFVTLKTATTLDGKIATVSGESQWITSSAARADVHRLRRMHDAIVVGVGTVLADDPLLTVRVEGQNGRHPLRVILDSGLRTPPTAKVVKDRSAPTWIFTTQRAKENQIAQLETCGVRVIQTRDEERVSVAAVLERLAEENILSVLVEGGGEVNASFLQGRHVQKVIAYVAPKLIGGNKAPGSFRGEGFQRLADAVELERIQYTQLGPDVKITGYVKEV